MTQGRGDSLEIWDLGEAVSMPFMLCFQPWHSLTPSVAGTSLHQAQEKQVMPIYLSVFTIHREFLG